MPPPPPRPPPPKRPIRGPQPLSPEKIRARSRGALIGLAVGDALGATNELKKMQAPPFPTLTPGFHTEMKGGGPFSVKPGQVTDDTQMACALSWSLRELKRFDAHDVVKRYIAWRPHAFDIGQETKDVLSQISSGRPWDRVGRDYWLGTSKRAASNGSLMRTAPIGVYFSNDQQTRVRASLEESALTHYDLRCQMACVAFNGVIAALIHAPDKGLSHDQIETAAVGEMAIAAAHYVKTAKDFYRDAQDAVALLKEDLSFARKEDPMLYGPDLHMHAHERFVRVAFRFAFWELFHATSFEAALVDVVNRGGDTDTNAAITGALLGAAHGEDEIPERWKTPVNEALSVPGRGPLWDLYHPRHLLPLSDK